METRQKTGFFSNLRLMARLRSFLASSKRVFVIAKKPSKEEFFTMAKVTGLGIIVIAVIGFIIQLIFAFTGVGFT